MFYSYLFILTKYILSQTTIVNLRSATPLVKEAAKTIGKEVISSGVGLLSDIATGKNFKKSVKSRVKEAGRNTLQSGVKKAKQTLGGRITPTPLKRKKPASLTLVARKPRKRQHREKDIFDL